MEPDLDWYVDHVVVPSGPELAPVGPVRSGQAEWLIRARELRLDADPDADPALARVLALAATQGFVVTPQQARDAGLRDADRRRLVRRGRWSQPRYGCVAVLGDGDDPALAAAATALRRPGDAISHASAAAVHCLPLLAPVGPPTLTTDHVHQANSRPDVRLHVASLPTDEVEDWFGARLTVIERTIVDLARARGVRQGLVAADAALHERLTTPRRLRRAVQRQAGWPGVRRARRAIALADDRTESVLESLTRFCLLRGGLPAPDLQVWVDTDDRAYRVDMLYRRERVIVEVDGLTKYGADRTALAREKRRQEYLERAGYRVVRVLWEDVTRRPEQVVARVRAALAGR